MGDLIKMATALELYTPLELDATLKELCSKINDILKEFNTRGFIVDGAVTKYHPNVYSINPISMVHISVYKRMTPYDIARGGKE